MKLWLDDIRPAPDGWTWVKNYDEAIDTLVAVMIARNMTILLHPGAEVKGEFTHMSFDHDLGEMHYRVANAEAQGRSTDHYVTTEKTGYDVALWMAEYNVWPTEEVRVHSYNGVGARRICGVVDRYGPYDRPCVWVPASRC